MTDDSSSSNLPAIRQPAREVARTDTDSWTTVFTEVLELARGIADTEFVPTSLRGSIPATTAAILYGREVGLPPMTALNSTHVIEGRPSLEAQAMRAMILAAGHELEILESTGQVCKMRARRNGAETWSPVVMWTLDMARAAGLLGKKNWDKYPRRMLQARCSSELAELYFPDVIMGFRSIEEMIDSTDENEPRDVETAPVARAPRKRAAKRATAPAPAAERPAADPGPPLPGEEPEAAETSTGAGTGGEATAPAPVDPDTAPEESTAQVHAEARSTTPLSDGRDAAAPPEPSLDGDDIHDAELVDEPTVEPTVDEPDEMCACGYLSSEPVAECGNHPDPDEPAHDPGPRLANRAQVRALNTVLERKYEVRGPERHRVVSVLISRPIVSLNALTADEISPLLDTLHMLEGRDALDAFVLAAEQRQTEGSTDE